MEKIYEWLLLHMGNEANYYTILNCQRAATAEGVHYLRIMGRLHEFKVVNLLIYSGFSNELPIIEPDKGSDNGQPEQISVSTPQQVIEYMATGKVADSSSHTNEDTFHISIFNPTGDAGEIIFPPEQSV